MISSTPFTVLNTERLNLRMLKETDEDAMVSLRCNDSVNEFIQRPKSMTNEEIKNFIIKLNENIINNTGLFWAITLKNEADLIGTICLWNFELEKAKGEIGFELFPEYQGKGLMKEAIKKVLDYAFNTVKLKTIEGVAHVNNVKSIGIMKSFGFEHDTNMEDKIEFEGEDLSKLVFYSISREQWI